MFERERASVRIGTANDDGARGIHRGIGKGDGPSGNGWKIRGKQSRRAGGCEIEAKQLGAVGHSLRSLAPATYKLPWPSVAAAATEVLPEPPVVFTHGNAGAKSVARAACEIARKAERIVAWSKLESPGICAREPALTECDLDAGISSVAKTAPFNGRAELKLHSTWRHQRTPGLRLCHRQDPKAPQP